MRHVDQRQPDIVQPDIGQRDVGQRIVSRWDDAVLAAAVFAVDPIGIGGIVVRARFGSSRDAWLAVLQSWLPTALALHRLPCNVTDDRLLGGIDLAASLAAGAPVAARGALAMADGGLVMLTLADRLAGSTAAHIAAALDTGFVMVERNGIAMRSPARFGIIAFDEGMEEDERPPASLVDRLGLLLDLGGVRPIPPARHEIDAMRASIDRARSRAGSVMADDDVIEALCAAAVALGISSIRAPMHALRVARANAALAGRERVEAGDVAVAARLVLAPRAVSLPTRAEQPSEDQPPREQGEEQAEGGSNTDTQAEAHDASASLSESVVAAALSALSPSVLDQLKSGSRRRAPSTTQGRSGATRQSTRRGRPIGSRPEQHRGAQRLDLIATLHAAAPWQLLRRNEAFAGQGVVRPPSDRQPLVLVRRQDFRVARFKQHMETATIFLVDASGSAALHRLAEAKGAVEVLLGECYVRRDQVALISFSGRGVETLLEPTRALARAKRSLAALPGGGGTPLASGLDAAAELARACARKGLSPLIVVLTDGRANIGRDGKPGRVKADADAMAAAGAIGTAGFAGLMLDISTHPAPLARNVAARMAASYLHLPHADARSVSTAVQQAGSILRSGERP